MPSAVQVLPGCGARPAAWSHKVKASWRASSSVLEQVTKTVAPGTAVVSPSGLAVSAAMTRRSSSSSSNRVPCSPIPTETIYRCCGERPKRGLSHSDLTPASLAANTSRSPASKASAVGTCSPRRMIAWSTYSWVPSSEAIPAISRFELVPMSVTDPASVVAYATESSIRR